MGRQLLKDEVMRNQVIDLAWGTIQRALNSKNVSLSEQRRIALELVKKSCPQSIGLDVCDNLADIIKKAYK